MDNIYSIDSTDLQGADGETLAELVSAQIQRDSRRYSAESFYVGDDD